MAKTKYFDKVRGEWVYADGAPQAQNFVKDVRVNGTSVTSEGIADVMVPTQLAQLADDPTHRVVTDSQISQWNAGGGGDTLDAEIHIYQSSASDDLHATLSSGTFQDLASKLSSGAPIRIHVRTDMYYESTLGQGSCMASSVSRFGNNSIIVNGIQSPIASFYGRSQNDYGTFYGLFGMYVEIASNGACTVGTYPEQYLVFGG